MADPTRINDFISEDEMNQEFNILSEEDMVFSLRLNFCLVGHFLNGKRVVGALRNHLTNDEVTTISATQFEPHFILGILFGNGEECLLSLMEFIKADNPTLIEVVTGTDVPLADMHQDDLLQELRTSEVNPYKAKVMWEVIRRNFPEIKQAMIGITTKQLEKFEKLLEDFDPKSAAAVSTQNNLEKKKERLLLHLLANDKVGWVFQFTCWLKHHISDQSFLDIFGAYLEFTN